MKTTPYTPPAVYCLFTSSLFYVYSSAPGSRALASVMDAVVFIGTLLNLVVACRVGLHPHVPTTLPPPSFLLLSLSLFPHTHSLASTPHTLPRNRSSCYFLLYLHPLFPSFVFVLSHTPHCTARMHTHYTAHNTSILEKKTNLELESRSL